MATNEGNEDPEPNLRQPCTLTPQTMRYLERLAKAGTHGSSKVPGVMTFLINQGIQDAIGKGIIKPEES
jgi:hypothetical protein